MPASLSAQLAAARASRAGARHPPHSTAGARPTGRQGRLEQARQWTKAAARVAVLRRRPRRRSVFLAASKILSSEVNKNVSDLGRVFLLLTRHIRQI